MTNILAVIDTFGYFFRSFYALPSLTSKDGFPTGVLMGFAKLINTLYNDNSTHLVFALEGEGEKVRKTLSPTYKANRREVDTQLLRQIEVALRWIKMMNLANISIDGYEADDAIASLSKTLQSADVWVKIVSADKDFYQLIGGNTYIYDPLKKREIRDKECFEKFGVLPAQFVDYQSLVGDSSDNIAGIKGIGEKSAQKLIAHFGSLDSMYERSDEIAGILTPRLAGKILEEKQSAYESRELVRLRDDLLPSVELESMLKPRENPLFLIADELERYNIRILSGITRAPSVESRGNLANPSENLRADSTDSVTHISAESRVESRADITASADSINQDSAIAPFKCVCITESGVLMRVIDSIERDCAVAFDTETDSLDTKSAQIVGFSFAFDKRTSYYVPLRHNYLGVESQVPLDAAKEALARLLRHKIIGHNLKFDIAVLRHNFALEVEDYCDTMVLAWLYDSAQKFSLDFQVKHHFNYTTIKFDEIVPKGESFASVNLVQATRYAAQDAMCALYLCEKFTQNLSEKLLQIAQRVEFPFIKTLIALESNGISVDVAFFTRLKAELSEKIKLLSDEIYALTGSVFNLNSTKQLGDILFNKLALKKGRVLKNSHFSTDEKTLESLRDAHPVIALLLEYRELNKLLGTYVLPMINLAQNRRIYTSFLHTGTATGRLSSRSPNLQNIPVKSDIGRKIRYGFVASDGYKLISADYSQIELRLLAHFSQDSALLRAFSEDKDIHLETAKRIFGEDFAQSHRHIAKSINFGLIYGMGAKKLSQQLGISYTQAKDYIESYFRNFPSVKGFLAQKESEIMQNGYAETLLGRRRIFDFSNIPQYEQLALLREGVNTIFQGSAADLIKLAMNECFKRFDNRAVRMLIQIHDELIFEVREDAVEGAVADIIGIMNNIYPLNVALKCGVNIGARWSELK